MTTCVSCGNPVDPAEPRCRRCGQPVDGQGWAQAQDWSAENDWGAGDWQQSAPPRKRRIGALIAIGVVTCLLIVAGGVGVWYWLLRGEPAATEDPAAAADFYGQILPDSYEGSLHEVWTTPVAAGNLADDTVTVLGYDSDSGIVGVRADTALVGLNAETGEEVWRALPAHGAKDCLGPWNNSWVCPGGLVFDSATGQETTLSLPGDASRYYSGRAGDTAVFWRMNDENTEASVVAFSQVGDPAWAKTFQGTIGGITQTDLLIVPTAEDGDGPGAERLLIDLATGDGRSAPSDWSTVGVLQDGTAVVAGDTLQVQDEAGQTLTSFPAEDFCMTSYNAFVVTTAEYRDVVTYQCNDRYRDDEVWISGRTSSAIFYSNLTDDRLELVGAPGQDRAGQTLWEEKARHTRISQGKLFQVNEQNEVSLLEPDQA